MKKKRIMRIPNAKEYEAQIGIRTPAQRLRIEGHLRAMMNIMRAMLKKNAARYYSMKPNQRKMCEGCGFRSSMVRRKGFVSTAYGIMIQVLQHKPFLCHANQQGWRQKKEVDINRAMICMGFALTADDSVVQQAAACANQKIEKELKP